MLLLTTLAAAAAIPAATPAAPPQSVEVQAPGPNGPLAGTLLQAGAQGAPVMLIIPGSGPTDRNGNRRSPRPPRAARIFAGWFWSPGQGGG